jgi:hypothetical protein
LLTVFRGGFGWPLPLGIARITAGRCEAIYMYSVLRWVVFRDAPPR